ncbi:hypothetical protein N7505_011991 [Penicillium chrysogenum]|uniref:Smr domain-containing protein n=1 Tax=Penicillium chrysogenum TaxID=5076 RepID=A0ABQ8W069_PENCH|nr:hypothetical protein N7505_011991 [Penicillium chrysogenum]
MVSDELLEQCLQILQDQALDEEEQVEKVEDFLRANTSLTGTPLENAVLDILWRHRNRNLPDASPPVRHTVIRRSSPAPWQMARSSTPLSPHSTLGTSPGSTSWMQNSRGPFSRPPLSSTVSPFTSPLQHRPRAGSAPPGALSATAVEFVPDMSPHDILRTVLGDKRSNDEIEAALEANSYDLGATIASLSHDIESEAISKQHDDGRVLVGKSMTMEQVRPVTPLGSSRSPVVSGDGCPFSHDPSALIGNLSVTDGSRPASPSPFQVDSGSDAFPPLQAADNGDQWANQYTGRYPAHLSAYQTSKYAPPGLLPGMGKRNGSATHLGRPNSRPSSRHQNRELNPAAPSVDDPDAFPTLAAVNAKNAGKKHHGKRGGHNNRETSLSKESVPSSLADVVRMTPSPAPGKTKSGSRNKETKGRENSAAAQSIPPPQNIPWLETGSRANQQYIKYRTEAIRHGTVRNKFLQSAAQAWNRNDARAAKALSLRGQAENDAMRRCHREAARQLYEERNQHLSHKGLDESSEELYVDLHGLHPEEAIEYLEKILLKHAREGLRVVYAITGTGHHSKNGKDKIGKAVKAWLNEWRYLFREFSVPGERGGYVGGILGIDPTSYDKTVPKELASELVGANAGGEPSILTMGKIQLLKREEIETQDQ